jgi:trk system potassium uptake protein TrkH
MNNFMRQISPMKTLLVGYAIYTFVGWILLCLPFAHETTSLSALDNLFTATSAVSTTGLATISTSDSYSFFGELVILTLIQFGGIGYMTLGSFILLARHVELSPRREQITKTAFALPDGFHVSRLLRSVILFTVAIESAGILALYFAFENAGVPNPLWQATFHSISAFCTAGFSLFSNGLEGFADDFWVNAIISTLSLSGAIGFLVMSDVFLSFTGRRERQTLTTRIILHATFWMLLVGWLLIFLIEPTFGDLPVEQRLMSSGFQAMTALTTVGFNTQPIGDFAHPTAFVMLLLMILGASPSGTGGGLKSTSVSAAFATVWSVLKGRNEVTFWGCRVPTQRLTLAFASVVFYVSIFFIGGLGLLLVQSQSLEDVLFEAASALGTVGLSRGLTSDLTPLGKLIVILLMFIGRLGPITFGLALFSNTTAVPKQDDLAV